MINMFIFALLDFAIKTKVNFMTVSLFLLLVLF